MPGRKGFLTWVGRAACPLRIRAVRLASDAADTTVGIMAVTMSTVPSKSA